MELKGIVEDVIFRNEDNGYTVVVLDVDGEPETVVGNFPLLAEGETVVCEGTYKQNAKYGRQFSASRIAPAAPESKAGIVRFLGSGLLPGVGEVTATNIVDKFGDRALDVIENDYPRLATIRGISLRKAKEIHEGYAVVSGMRAAIVFLQEYGIGAGTAVKIYKRYGAQTEALVRANPYRLVEDVEGIGFLTADRIARNLGIGEDSEFRIRAGLIHLLKTAAERNGHTYLPIEELTGELRALLGTELTIESVTDLCGAMAIAGVTKLQTLADGTRVVMLERFFRLEKGIADKLTTLARDADQASFDADAEISEYESGHGIIFHEVQRLAIKLALEEGVCVITGGPGTGKTTIINCVMTVLRLKGHTVRLLAPTGRAAKRMSEATGAEASTVHRALQSEGEGGKFSKNETNPIEATCVIVDEVSMVDAFLMNALLKALRPGTRLILVGDRDQLASVGAGNVLADILASGAIPSVALTQIYRQALASRIVTNAHLINAGEMPVVTNGKDSDFFFLNRETPEAIANTVVETATDRIPTYLGIEPQRVQVLSPLKAGVAGVTALNERIQQALNPASPEKAELPFGDTVYRVGDKVMHVVNDYDLTWTRRDLLGATEGSGVFNGDIGTVAAIYPSRECDVVYEDGKVVRYTSDRLDELMLSYAITVHKSQGCEFDAVIMPILGGSPMMLTRNLLYTGITRAKRLVVLIGSKYHLERMVHNDFTQKRYSRLKELLERDRLLFLDR